ncbi:MAG: ATP-binding protein [Candidatus Margulisbacteria bacterium]|jgi:predicted AAA+ superfamily ATPase|nr:ATP-binding protein [Candidatus Margulisiibacteriota bacterium]
MINREMSGYIKKLKTQFPVIAIVGPRQSGKTTLIKECFKNYKYFNLENPDTLVQIESDPGGFMRNNKEKVIIDEVQKYSKLMSYLQVYSDEIGKMGNFVISGSENLLLSEKISQSLAGRAAYATLLPLTIAESKAKNYYDCIFYGGYPGLISKKLDPLEFYNQYINTYVERDAKQIVNIRNLSLFRKLLFLLAGRVGSIINYNSLANEIGVDHKTIEGWLSVLETTYVIYKLQPFYENFGKRYIKSAKIYFTDTGLVCRLLGIQKSTELQTNNMTGHLFENLIIANTLKHFFNSGKRNNLYFFRDTVGNEVDLIIESGNALSVCEIKSAYTYNKVFEKGLTYFEQIIKSSRYKLLDKNVIYTGDSFTTGNVKVIKWSEYMSGSH